MKNKHSCPLSIPVPPASALVRPRFLVVSPEMYVSSSPLTGVHSRRHSQAQPLPMDTLPVASTFWVLQWRAGGQAWTPVCARGAALWPQVVLLMVFSPGLFDKWELLLSFHGAELQNA